METLTISPGSEPPRGEVELPGSKSFTNRALIVAALANGESRLEGVSLSDDSRIMLKALDNFGVRSNLVGDVVTIQGISSFNFGDVSCDIGHAGTSMRFLAAFAALSSKGKVLLSGSHRMHERPIGDLASALTQLGCEVAFLERAGCPPLSIVGGVKNRRVTISGDTSSQFISALLMIGPLLPQGLELAVTGDQVSRSYIDMTLAVMKEFGINVVNSGYQRYAIEPGHYRARTYRVEGDLSGASYFWGLAAMTGGEIRVKNLSPSRTQGDLRFPELLKKMGSSVDEGSDAAGREWILVRGEKLEGIECNMNEMPDTAQTLSVVAACAKGNTTIRGLSTLKGKETDRIAALSKELEKVGVQAIDLGDGLLVEPAALRSARISTYQDHRMAMSFGILGGVVPIEIEEPSVVSKSFPNFWDTLAKLGLEVRLIV